MATLISAKTPAQRPQPSQLPELLEATMGAIEIVSAPPRDGEGTCPLTVNISRRSHLFKREGMDQQGVLRMMVGCALEMASWIDMVKP